jgi:hypothetical protein
MPSIDPQGEPHVPDEPRLARSLNLPGAVALNMLDMIGVGPFITLPLILAAMGGPQAMLGWILGAGLALCDGLVWAELGAAMPEAGGSYAFLRKIYSRPDYSRPDGVSVHLSTDLLGAALGRVGVHRAESVCRVYLAGAGGACGCADGAHWGV